MNKNFKKAKDKLGKTQTKLAALNERLDGVRLKLEESTQTLSKLNKQFGRVQLKGTPEEVLKVESDRLDVSTEIDRLMALIPALEIEIKDAEAQVLKDRELKNEAIAELLANWYASEVKSYDSLAEKMTKSIRRLTTAYQIADSIGRRDVVKSALGPAFQYIGQSRFPKISGFTFQDFTTAKGKFNPGEDFKNEIFGEIIQINGGK